MIAARGAPENGGHEQGGRHRTQNEGAGAVHEAVGGTWRSTRAPSRRRSAPVTTTSSPGVRPAVIATSSPSATPRVTSRARTVWSGLTTYTKALRLLRCTAADGTTVAPRFVSRSSRALTNWLGKRWLSSLGKTAFSLTVPVVWSTWLSMVRSEPA